MLAVVLVVQAAFRVADLGDAAREATSLGTAQRELAGLARAPEVRACRPVAVSAIEGQTAAAWWLELPVGEVDVSRSPPPAGAYLVREGPGWRLASGCGVRAP